MRFSKARHQLSPLTCVRNSMANRTRGTTMLLLSALMRSHVEYHVQSGGPHYKKDIEVLSTSKERQESC